MILNSTFIIPINTMKAGILIPIFFLLYSCNSESGAGLTVQSGNSHKEEAPTIKDTIPGKKPVKATEVFTCDISAWTSSSGKNSTFVIYPQPNDSGRQLIKLNSSCDHVASAYESVYGWFHLSAIYTSDDCEDEKANNQNLGKQLPCWVKSGSLYVGVAGAGDGDTFKLFRNPADTAPVIGYTPGQGWKPIAANGKWLLVEGFTKNGKNITGWIPPEVQCINPFTNCCNDFTKYIFSLVPSAK
jgi:hypothetical protein